MRKELYELLQAIDEAVKDEPPAVPSRVPPEDWEGWSTVLTVMGLKDLRHVMALAREAVARVRRREAGEVSVQVEENAPGVEDGYSDCVRRMALEGCAPLGLGARIVREMQVDTEEPMFEIWAPSHGGLSWVTEAILRAEFGGIAEAMLAGWQASRAASRPAPHAVEFDPAGAMPLPYDCQVLTPLRTPQHKSTLPRSAQWPSGRPRCSRQEAEGKGAGAEALRVQLQDSRRRLGSPSGSPVSNRRSGDGAASYQPGGRDGPQGELRDGQPRQQPSSVHLDGGDPNSSYIDLEARAALWKAFTDAFARARQRKWQMLQERIVLARHSARFGAMLTARAGRQSHNAGAVLEGDDDFVCGVAHKQPHPQAGRHPTAAPGSAVDKTPPCAVDVAARANRVLQRKNLDAAAVGMVSGMPAQRLRPGVQEEEVMETEEPQEGDRDWGPEQRPKKRRRRVHEGHVATCCGDDGVGIRDPSQPGRPTGPRQQQQPGDEQPRAAASPAPPDQLADSPTRWSSATSAGETNSNPDECAITSASRRKFHSLAPAEVDAGVSPTQRLKSTQEHVEPPRYRRGILLDARAEAAWKELGRVLRVCRAAARQENANGGAELAPTCGPGAVASTAQPSAARVADDPPGQLAEERAQPPTSALPPADGGVRTVRSGAAEAALGEDFPAGGGACPPEEAAYVADGSDAAALANRTGGMRPTSQLHQSPVIRGRCLPVSLVHRGLPRTGLDYSGTGTVQPREADLAAQSQPGASISPGRGGNRQQPEHLPASDIPGAPPRPRNVTGAPVTAPDAAGAARSPAGVQQWAGLQGGVPEGATDVTTSRRRNGAERLRQNADGPRYAAASLQEDAVGVVSCDGEVAAPQAPSAVTGDDCGLVGSSAAREKPGAVGVDESLPNGSMSFEEPMCGQRQSHNGTLGTQPDSVEGQASGPAPQHAKQSDAVAARPHGLPVAFTTQDEDEARDRPHGLQRAAAHEGERNGPPEEQLLAFASQGIQTGQGLLDNGLLGRQQQDEPLRHAVGVQTSQGLAHAVPLLAALSESPWAIPEEQPAIGNLTAYVDQVGTVVGVKVARPQLEGPQRFGKLPRPRQSHPGSCQAMLAAEASAIPATVIEAQRARANGESVPASRDGAAATASSGRWPGRAAAAVGGYTGIQAEPAQQGPRGHDCATPDATADGSDVTAGAARELARAGAAHAATVVAVPPPQQLLMAAVTGFSRGAEPVFGRFALHGAPLGKAWAWLGSGCTPLVTPSLSRDSLNVRNVAAGITSWPDVTMAVLGHLHTNPPLRRPGQRPAVGRRTAADGCGEQWQEYWLVQQISSGVEEVEELEGLLPMARDVLGGPPPAGGHLAAPGRAVASLDAAMRCLAGHGSRVGADRDVHGLGGAAVTHGQPEQPGWVDTPGWDVDGPANTPGAGPLADQSVGAHRALDGNAEVDAQLAVGEVVPEEAAEVAVLGAGETQRPNVQQLELRPLAGPPTQDHGFALLSAPPDFFTQPFTQPF